MKFKPALLMIGGALLLTSCYYAYQPASSSSSVEPSSSKAFEPEYLTFVDGGKLRVDFFDVTDIKLSYGNASLDKASNSVALDANAVFSVSQNSEAEKLHIIYFAETPTRHSQKYTKLSGVDLVNTYTFNGMKAFFKEFVGPDARGYCAISAGEKPNWAKGLNEKIDREFEALTPEEE